MIASQSLLEQPGDEMRGTRAGGCEHCGQAVPPGERFCCAGCRALASIMAEHSPGTGPFGHFDDPTFARLCVRPIGPDLARVELAIDGMHCASCVGALESLAQRHAGIVEARVAFAQGTVRVIYDPRKVRVSRIAEIVKEMGYTPTLAKGASHRDSRVRGERAALIRLGIAGAIAGNVMMMGFALWGGEMHGMESVYSTLFRWLSTILGVTQLVWPGGVFFRSAWNAIRSRTTNLDVPISMALAAGLITGVVNTGLGRGEIYFDSLTGLVFLLLVGRYFQQRQQRWAAEAVELLFSLTPARARLVSANAVREVPTESLEPGDLIEVLAGESFPADGVIETGRTSIDESILTGESRPLAAGEGTEIHAGTVNLDSMVRARVSAAGKETRAGKLMQLVAESAARKPRIVHFTDRVGAWFTAGITLAAALTFVCWLPKGTIAALDHATTLLIVTCPCALGIAVPLVFSMALGRAAKAGFLVKGADVLETLAKPGTMFVDKTGTLTQGKLQVIEWLGDDEALPLAAALEAQVSHPAARAITDFAKGSRIEAAEAVQTLGGGVRGRVRGLDVAVGTTSFLASTGAYVPQRLNAMAGDLAARELSPVFISVDGVARGIFAMGDPIRPDAKTALGTLAARGWTVRMLSGDLPSIAAVVGGRLGLAANRCQGGMSPEHKLAIVRQAAEAGPAVMVGDGVNDAAALAAASVGIAVHGGAEASLQAADVYVAKAGVDAIVELAEASARTMRVIRTQLAASLMYNLLAAMLAANGWISPMIAAAMMPASSLTVLAIAVRSRTFDKPRASESRERA